MSCSRQRPERKFGETLFDDAPPRAPAPPAPKPEPPAGKRPLRRAGRREPPALELPQALLEQPLTPEQSQEWPPEEAAAGWYEGDRAPHDGPLDDGFSPNEPPRHWGEELHSLPADDAGAAAESEAGLAEPELERAGGEVGGEAGAEAGGRRPSALNAPARGPKVQKCILLDAQDPSEVRVVLVENGVLEELHIERAEEKKYVGNIYKGKVVNIEPAIQAAFVDIGIGRNGFLHVTDVLPAYTNALSIPIDSLSKRLPDRRRLLIQNMLRKGQEILVQISKDSLGAKGPSLTTYVSLPGKYLVLMPGISRFGVSKRIQDGGERAKLRESLSRLDPPRGLGYIIRTAGKELAPEALEKDLKNLVAAWEGLCRRLQELDAPGQVYEESDLLYRALRDLCGPDVDEILVNDEGAFRRVQDFIADVMPSWEGKARLYNGAVPLFSKYGVEAEIEDTYNRRVPLPSGGYLIIEQTEALVAIDVNSGRYTKEEDLEDTALKTNLEAAAAIARQLRLRDLGGVIINDFIDMVQEKNRREVERAFKAALRRDRAKCWLSRISRFGIIEMTRQRVRPSLERAVFEPCEHCHGIGAVKSPRVTAAAILRQLRANLSLRKKETAEVVAHPAVHSFLLNERRRQICELEERFQKTIVVHADPGLAREQFSIRFQ